MKKCKFCKKPFKPTYNTIQPFCSGDCAILFNRQNSINNWTKEQKKELKKGNYVQTLQRYVNTIVKELDKENGCISCGNTNARKYDAGHFRKVSTYGYLRFDLFNIYKQCVNCNKNLDGNEFEYGKALERIGKLKIIEEHKQKYNGLRFSIPELKEAITAAKSALKNLTDRETINKDLGLYK